MKEAKDQGRKGRKEVLKKVKELISKLDDYFTIRYPSDFASYVENNLVSVDATSIASMIREGKDFLSYLEKKGSNKDYYYEVLNSYFSEKTIVPAEEVLKELNAEVLVENLETAKQGFLLLNVKGNDVVILTTKYPVSNVVSYLKHLRGLSVSKVIYRLASKETVKKVLEAVLEELTVPALDGIEGSLSDLKIEGGEAGQKLAELELTQEEEGRISAFVYGLLADCVKKGYSDVHLEPVSGKFRIRVRQDGILRVYKDSLPLSIYGNVVAKIKLMANLDVTERRLPQDGQIKASLSGRTVEFRVSTLPTVRGEKVVLRILDKTNLTLDLSKLGFLDREYELLLNAIKKPYGMILVTGPTGSGKTTTLYSCLSLINDVGINISTAEDPVEYEIEGLNQVNVNPKIGLTFPRVLRAFLRQDPDVILVGEIRDAETAKTAVEAALTGHLLFSTLHTNNAVEAVTRLEEMGIERYLIAGSLLVVVAQRLVRKVCPYCAEEVPLNSEVLKELGVKGKEELDVYLKWARTNNLTYKKGKGCSKCDGTGYKGRTGLYEVLEVNESVKRLLVSSEFTTVQLNETARRSGFRTMKDCGIVKILRGETTPEEVLRVVK